jgi:hypothetical protein
MFKLMNLKKAAQKFHENESGLEALQVVMIIAIAALVLLVVKYFWDNNIYSWVKQLVTSITGWTSGTSGS